MRWSHIINNDQILGSFTYYFTFIFFRYLVVYKIHCSNCEAVYIGETSQFLKNRVNNHKYNVNWDECTALLEMQ